MTCPDCQHGNANDAHFRGASLTQPTTAAAPAPDRRRKSRPLVLAVLVLLLLAIGMSAAFHFLTPKSGTPAAGDGMPRGRLADYGATAALPTPRPPVVGAAIGGAPGTGVKGAADTAKAAATATPSGQPAANREGSGGSAVTPNAPDGASTATAVEGFLSAVSSAVGGAHPHDPVDFHTLEVLLPASLPGMQPARPDGTADETMSIKTTSAHVEFTGPNDARINLSIKDATAISGLAGLAEMAGTQATEQGDSYEKNETIGGRSVHEKWDAAARHGELSLSVGRRFAVDVVGDRVDMDALKTALAHIDLARLEAMKDANPIAR